MSVAVPDFCLVLLLGSSAAAMADFAARNFGSGEIIGPDLNGDALHATVEHRFSRRTSTAIDITDATSDDRAALLRIAKRTFTQPVAIALLADGKKGSMRIRALREIVQKLERDGVRAVHVLREGDDVGIVREPLATDRRDLTGPFDIIGDVHGCTDELETLLGKLGYAVAWRDDAGERRVTVTPPLGRRLIFVGDLVDRGPRTPDTLRIVMSVAAAGTGFCVPGNHDAKFMRWLGGRNVTLTHGLDRSVAQMGSEPKPFHQAVKLFLEALPSHIWCDGGRLVIAHAGLTADMIGRSTAAVRELCLYGDTDGDTDANGLALRYHWAAEYGGDTTIVYGHTPVADAIWFNNTLCLDTGCCFGGKLSALRWPEREIVTVPALQQYAPPRRLFGHPPPRSTGTE
ncbi:MAG: metallophosphoesterase [Hyphomicrobiaceae bacterium]